ncbi:MAG: hypothetical protein QM529_04105 [Hydrotalea sp.]|nr:hypothetical protein [Hydrotalea sp.]
MPLHESLLAASILLIAVAWWMFHSNYDVFARTYGSEILVTLGILFCFAGITFGLLNFDTQNVEKSIPDLIEGIKFSFISSFSGIFFSLLLRGLKRGKSPTLNTRSPEGATTADMVALQQELNDGLIGDNKESLVSQFKIFAETMAENNIKALEKVVNDFNKNLTEQFGENFKQLNSAVKDLVVWQRQYKEELEEMKDAIGNLVSSYEKTSDGMENAAKNLQAITANLSTFSESAKAIENVVKVMDEQVKTIYEQQKSTAVAFDKIKEIAPTVERVMGDYLDQLQKGLNAFETQLASLSGKFVDDYTPLTQRLQSVIKMAEKIK